MKHKEGVNINLLISQESDVWGILIYFYCF